MGAGWMDSATGALHERQESSSHTVDHQPETLPSRHKRVASGRDTVIAELHIEMYKMQQESAGIERHSASRSSDDDQLLRPSSHISQNSSHLIIHRVARCVADI